MLLEGGRSFSLEDAFIFQSPLLDLSAAILQHFGMSLAGNDQYLEMVRERSAFFSVFTYIMSMKFKIYAAPK